MKIGIIICNYNKEDYVLKCVRSILDSTVTNFNIVVVDNASEDNSVKRIKEEFGSKITTIRNKKNLGGSGGFNTGLRFLLKENYQYIMCVDNDVIFEPKAIEELCGFLEKHTEVGMAGAKICSMDHPERIQTYGASIDFENYTVKDHYKNQVDDKSIPEYEYCDYVPACALMMRTQALKEVGMMPEDNYIYWDDMEWGYLFNHKGYRVAAVSASKVWHKGGGAVSTNTFQKYYMFRNRIHFFRKYLDRNKLEQFGRVILTELYQSICSCDLKGESNMLKTFMFAYHDAIVGKRGKAEDYKILPRNRKERLQELLLNKNNILILFDGDYVTLGNVIDKIKEFSLQCSITIGICRETTNMEDVKKQFSQHKISYATDYSEYDLVLNQCSHIFEIPKNNRVGIYIDKWMNLIITKEELETAKNFKENSRMFVEALLPVFMAEQ